jgi:WD40 repeat protein
VPGDDITALALDDHGRVITGHLSGAIRLWDARTGALVSAATEHTATVSSIDFRGETFVTNSWDLTTRLWDAHTGAQRRVLKRFDAGGYDVELSPNGDLLASADGGAVVNLWDRQHGRLLARYPTLAEATQAAFLDDDHLVVGDTAGHAEIFDIAVPPRTPDEIARAVAASRWQLDGSRVSERR